ncbi:arsenate reductase and related [Dethiobacter alkaliphilus AHT 1]|uniref:Arsenate reductase and related n=1 Tax=Dethiobacter alkaliphilus AHT 1 TaxID=555088 RepID=C0GJ78_DETAL|nr:arsenate reductase and related [Dethiobacter alkaliphilus AHT 1]
MEFTYRNILKEPPTAQELEELAKRAGLQVNELINPKSKAFKDVGKDAEAVSPQEAKELISANPRIMYRPLLTDGKRLTMGFKPEEMEALL